MKIISFIVQSDEQLQELIRFAQQHLGIQPAQVRTIVPKVNKRPLDMIREAKEHLKDEFEKDF